MWFFTEVCFVDMAVFVGNDYYFVLMVQILIFFFRWLLFVRFKHFKVL